MWSCFEANAINLTWLVDPGGELPGTDRGSDEGKDDRRGEERAGSWRTEWRETWENSTTQSENMKSTTGLYWPLQDTNHTTAHKHDLTALNISAAWIMWTVCGFSVHMEYLYLQKCAKIMYRNIIIKNSG